MRVLHCINSLSSGGAEKQLQILCHMWNDSSIEHTIFCVNDHGNEIPSDKAQIFKAADPNPYSKGYWQSLRSALAEFDPAVVHVWLPASMTIPAMLLSKLRGRRVIFSYRSRMRFHRPLSYPEFATALCCADRIVSNNPIVDSHPAFRWLYARKRGVVIRNAVAVPPNFVRCGPFPHEDGKWRLTCIGRLTPAKNLLAVIEAVAALPPSPPWQLDIYGEGELRDALATAIRSHNLADRVTLHSYCPDVYARMAASDLLLMPSLWEGMPNVALEALAIGLPVVISGIPAHRELLPDNGTVLWVDPERPEDIASAISRCLHGCIDLPGMAKRGQQFARAFSPEHLIAQYRNLYSETAG